MKYYYRSKYITSARKIVLKLGTRILLSHQNHSDQGIFDQMISDICDLQQKGYTFCIVTSGAVGFGMDALNIEHRPTDLKKIQACASIGQCLLMEKWISHFQSRGLQVGQILLTYDIIENRNRFLYARDSMNALIEYGAVPVINENDSVAIDELRFGDNDTLSALTSHLMGADLLILFTDTEGIFTKNPHKYADAERISLIEEVNDDIYHLIEDKKNNLSVGGMESKLKAAELSARGGTGVVITDGYHPNLKAILDGQDIGTFIKPDTKLVKERKRWIFFNQRIKGKIFVDDGAANALLYHQKSLLPGGVTGVEKSFSEGSIVGIFNSKKELIGKGITYYSSEDIEKIKGVSTDKIKEIIGEKYYNHIIHRDNMIILRRRDHESNH